MIYSRQQILTQLVTASLVLPQVVMNELNRFFQHIFKEMVELSAQRDTSLLPEK